MLPTEDAIAVSTGLSDRFGLPYWQFTLTATDANRHAIRYARHLTGRPKIVVHNYCYHGSVDETFATLDDDARTTNRRNSIGPPVDTSETTRVVEFNDVDGLEKALSKATWQPSSSEPALTNIGIVLPDEGYNEAVRELATKHGAMLINDETHTICAGPVASLVATTCTPTSSSSASRSGRGALRHLRFHPGRGGPHRPLRRAGGHRRGWHRWHPRRERPVHGGHEGDPRARHDAGRLRPHDPAGGRLGGRYPGRDRRCPAR